MRQDIFQRLLNINREFYQNFGQAFAQTRRRVQPGVRRALAQWITNGDWLDIGCGSGTLSREWRSAGLKGSYTGVDFSLPLLKEAAALQQNPLESDELTVSFLQTDLTAPDWASVLPRRVYDGVVAFASLHHIPSAAYRQQLLDTIARMTKPGGLLILSVWQFQHSPRLMARVLPWRLADIAEEDLEAGDTLLDWRYHPGDTGAAPGLRYVHLFTPEELQALARETGFEVVTAYESDGSGGRLGLYQVWQRAAL